MSRYAVKIVLSFSVIWSSQWIMASETALVKRCQSIQTEIDRLSNLKRKGGDGRQMNRWHKKRNEFKKRYGDLDCKRVRHLLD